METERPRAPSSVGRRELARAAIGYLALAIGLTWPLVSVLGSRFAGNRPLDIWVSAWNLWWMRQALTVYRTNPFETRQIFYPDGVGLYLHSYTPLTDLMALPAGLLWGTAVAYNTTAIIALALAGWATYALARRWVGPGGAALAGAAFASAPWLLHQLRVGHLNLTNAGPLALALLLLARAVESGAWRDRLLAALAMLAATLVDLHFAIYLAVAGAILGGERLLAADTAVELRRRLARLASVAALTGLGLLPLAVGALGQGATIEPEDQAKYRREQVEYSADLVAYIVPQLLHPVWGRTVNAWLVEHPLGAPTEGRVGLTLTGLALAAVALVARGPGVGLWGAIGLVGLLLSLGPRPHVGGVELGVPGPYALVGDLPLIGFSRVPARFAVLPALAVAVLAGIGLAVVSGVAAGRWGVGGQRAVMLTLVALFLFEALPAPYPSIAPPSLALAEQLAAEGGGAVLELPYLADDSPRMLYQTVHGRPIFSGYIARRPPKPLLERVPVLANLMRSSDAPEIIEAGDPLGALATLGVTTIVVYRPPYYRPDVEERTPSEAQMQRRVQAVLGATGPTWEDETGALYRVPPAVPRPLLTLGAGWHAPEPWPGGWMRWMPAEAEIRLDRAGPGPVVVSFTGWSFGRPRTVEVSLDGTTLARLALTPEPRPYQFVVPAGGSPTRLRWRSLDGAESPASLGLGNDPRLLAAAVAGLRVTASVASAGMAGGSVDTGQRKKYGPA